MTSAQENRRSFERFETDHQVIYKKNDKKELFKGKLKNLNGNGILIQSDHPAATGDLLDLSTVSDNKSIPIFQALVKVSRCSAYPGGDGYHIAGTVIELHR